MKKYSFWIGMFILVVTHVYMLFVGLSADQMVTHAVLNLIAGFFLAYSHYAKK